MGAAITALVLAVILPIIFGSMAKTENTDTHHFTMRAAKKPVLIIGIGGAIVFGSFIALSTIAGQVGFLTTGIFLLFFLCYLSIAMLAVPGFYDDTVDGDKLISHRFFMRSEANIKDIAKYKYTQGGIRLYDKDGRKICQLESVFMNLDTFIQRMEEEGIKAEKPDPGKKKKRKW